MLSLVVAGGATHAQVLVPGEQTQPGDAADEVPGGRAPPRNVELFRPFSGDAAGLPEAPSSLAGQTLVTPRSQAYLPSALPLPERLASGQGMRVGSFALQAVTGTSLAYDDNINASNEDREGDFIWSVNQAVRAQSLFRRHSLGFQASAGTGQYLQHRSDSEINWLVGTDGRLDFDRNSSLSGNLTYTRDEEDPEAEDAASNSGDNVYHLFNGGASYNHQFRVFNWSFSGNASRIEYENGDDNGRDRWSYGLATSVGYEVNDRLSVNVTPTYNRSFYDESSGEDGGDEDTHGYSLSAGASYEVGPRLSANGSIGYSWQFADDETQGVIFSGGLFYVIDGSTSAALSVGRSIGDTDVEGASTEISTTASVSLTRALRRDMALGFSLGASRNEFEGISRKDDNVFATVGYGYAVNDSIALTASYRYSQRFSAEDEEDFNRNVFVLGLTFRL